MIRDIERVIIVVIAGVAVYLGYRLFYIAKEKQGELKLNGKDYSFGISDVAPGIYFALFGSFILVSSLYSKVENTQESTTTSTKGSTTVKTASRKIASIESYSEYNNYNFEDKKQVDYKNLLWYKNLCANLADDNKIPKKIVAKDALETIKNSTSDIVSEEGYRNLLEKADSFLKLHTFIDSYLPFFVATYSKTELQE